MKTFSFTAIIAAFLFICTNGIQAQTKPTSPANINQFEMINQLHSNLPPEIKQPFDAKKHQLPQGFENFINPKTWKVKQLKSEMEGTQLLDSTITEKWDTLTNQWVVRGKTVIIYDAIGNQTSKREWTGDEFFYEYSFDAKGNVIMSIPYLWDSYYDNWIPFYRRYRDSPIPITKREYAYDANGNMTLDIEYGLESTNQWVYSKKWEFAFDENGKQTLESGYDWDATTSQWIGKDGYPKSETTYDTNGSMTLKISYNWDYEANLWYADHKEESTYDANGKITLRTGSQWNYNTNQWNATWKEETAYNENGNQKISISYSWDKTTSQWVEGDKNKYESTFDVNGNLTLYVGYEWDKTTSKWISASKYEYTYDENGKQTLESYYVWVRTTNLWVNNSKRECTYDVNGNQTLLSVYTWDAPTNQWIGFGKVEQRYDVHGNQILYSSYVWDATSQWRVYNKEESTYDAKGNGTLYAKYNWYYYINQLVGFGEKYEWTYEDNGRMTLCFQYNWDTITSKWIDNTKTTYYYSDHNITNISQTLETQLRVYPNPATNKISIATNSNLQGETTVCIFNMNGAILKQEKFQSQNLIEMDLSAMAKSIYLLQIQTKAGVENKKLVVQ